MIRFLEIVTASFGVGMLLLALFVSLEITEYLHRYGPQYALMGATVLSTIWVFAIIPEALRGWHGLIRRRYDEYTHDSL